MHWLVDGHNLIGQMPNLRLSDTNDEAQLLEYLRRYRARTGHRLTVIFDAGQTYQPAEKKKAGGPYYSVRAPRANRRPDHHAAASEGKKPPGGGGR